MQNIKPINLALQGGGAHGAFAWGVLDRLLEDGRLSIEAITATSAGAMNAAVLAYGFAIGERDGARAKLEEFWQAISAAGRMWSPVGANPFEKVFAAWGFKSDLDPSFLAFQAMTHMLSPYQLNPLNLNPLKDVLVKVIDFDRLCASKTSPRLFISATNVRNGKIRVFESHEMSPDVLLASACLPYLFQAVEIGGEHFWDGGFMGNPAIFPVIYNGASRDVVIVHINPIEHAHLPTTAAEIFDRMNEISFNSSLMREMRAIAFVSKLIDDGALDGTRYRRMLVHSIRDDARMADLGVATKLNTDWDFLCGLRDSGRQVASDWLARHYDAIGRETTVDLAATYL